MGVKSKTGQKSSSTKRAVGRPSEDPYDPLRHPAWAKSMARDGLIMDEIARELGVSRDRLYEWKKKYPEFSDALRLGRAESDAKVKESLFKRACGFSYEKTKTVVSDDGKVRSEVEEVIVVPDTTACIFWLKNRCPEEYTETYRQELTGRDGGPVRLQNMSDDDLDAKVAGILERRKGLSS